MSSALLTLLLLLYVYCFLHLSLSLFRPENHFKRTNVLMNIPGEWISGSAGMGFTPHVLTIAVGEVSDEKTFQCTFSFLIAKCHCVII